MKAKLIVNNVTRGATTVARKSVKFGINVAATALGASSVVVGAAGCLAYAGACAGAFCAEQMSRSVDAL